MEKVLAKTWKLLSGLLYVIVYRICHLRIAEDKWNVFLQFIKFGIIGLSNTIISYVIYVVSLLLFQKYNLLPKIDYLIAQLIGFLISVLWSFCWNRKYVFTDNKEQIPWGRALLKTYISYAFTGIFLNSALSVLWVELLKVPKIIAPIINLLISVPLNFILNKFWAFRKQKK